MFFPNFILRLYPYDMYGIRRCSIVSCVLLFKQDGEYVQQMHKPFIYWCDVMRLPVMNPKVGGPPVEHFGNPYTGRSCTSTVVRLSGGEGCLYSKIRSKLTINQNNQFLRSRKLIYALKNQKIVICGNYAR